MLKQPHINKNKPKDKTGKQLENTTLNTFLTKNTNVSMGCYDGMRLRISIQYAVCPAKAVSFASYAMFTIKHSQPDTLKSCGWAGLSICCHQRGKGKC